MFGAKARKIKRLEAELIQEKDLNQAALMNLTKKYNEVREKVVGLTADRDGARSQVEGMKSHYAEAENIRQHNNQLEIALADMTSERDQFAKRVEELEGKIQTRVEAAQYLNAQEKDSLES